MEAVYEQAKRALRLGATRDELIEVFKTARIPGRAPTLATGLQALMRIEDEAKKGKEE